MNEDKAARYHKQRRRAAVAGVAWSAGLLLVLALTPGSVWLRQLAGTVAAWQPGPSWLTPSATVAIYVSLLGVMHEGGALLIGAYRLLLDRRYDLSTETGRAWLLDQLKALGIGAALALPAFAALYLAIGRWPAGWWLVAGAGFVLLTIVLARLAPVVLLPIFFRFGPLEREGLRQRLLDLCQRAGVEVVDACVWQLSDRTRRANAALAGLGRTRRILVSDTLLAVAPDEEIEAVLAHEIGHHVRGDIWRGIALESAVALGGFFLASRVLGWAWRPLGWTGVADVAGLPVLLLVAGLLSALLLPLANAYSRRVERRADRFALELTGNPAAFAGAMQRLAVLNLAEAEPSRLAVWLFHSHPPVAARIAAARAWNPTEP
ncbi:MAG TPA: M48 family metalloprotease [Vicinamibacterales bacterium]|nr:M48 family metalloprotease [Vicinamibacterales bacterium]